MRDNVYAEYKDSVHDRNRSGMRAVCTDCHVPREPDAMLLAKLYASRNLYHKLAGSIGTREKRDQTAGAGATGMAAHEGDRLPRTERKTAGHRRECKQDC